MTWKILLAEEGSGEDEKSLFSLWLLNPLAENSATAVPLEYVKQRRIWQFWP